MSTIDLSIDRLALDGLALGPREARAARTAVEAELSRLLTEAHDLPARLARGGAVGRLSRTPLQIDTYTNPTDLGTQIARALYTGMGGGTPWAS
jgi:hypothetical protein